MINCGHCCLVCFIFLQCNPLRLSQMLDYNRLLVYKMSSKKIPRNQAFGKWHRSEKLRLNMFQLRFFTERFFVRSCRKVFKMDYIFRKRFRSMTSSVGDGKFWMRSEKLTIIYTLLSSMLFALQMYFEQYYSELNTITINCALACLCYVHP